MSGIATRWKRIPNGRPTAASRWKKTRSSTWKPDSEPGAVLRSTLNELSFDDEVLVVEGTTVLRHGEVGVLQPRAAHSN